jgi:hypothetical protein
MTNLPYSLTSELVAYHQRELEGSAARWRLRRRRPADPVEPIPDRWVVRNRPTTIEVRRVEPAGHQIPTAA